jgi:hypothetical protein
LKNQAMFSRSRPGAGKLRGPRYQAYVQVELEIAAFETQSGYINRSLKLVRLMGMLWPTLETCLTRYRSGAGLVVVKF